MLDALIAWSPGHGIRARLNNKVPRSPGNFEPPPRTAEQKARDRAIHERYAGRTVHTKELLDDLEHGATMGEWYEAHRVMVELKKLRIARDISTAEIADRAGISEDRVKALEAGHVTGPYLDTLVEYAHALGKRIFVHLADASLVNKSR